MTVRGETLSQDENDSRVKQAIEMEDPGIVMDLRHLNSGRKSQYDTFWEACEKYLQEVYVASGYCCR